MGSRVHPACDQQIACTPDPQEIYIAAVVMQWRCSSCSHSVYIPTSCVPTSLVVAQIVCACYEMYSCCVYSCCVCSSCTFTVCVLTFILLVGAALFLDRIHRLVDLLEQLVHYTTTTMQMQMQMQQQYHHHITSSMHTMLVRLPLQCIEDHSQQLVYTTLVV